MPLAGTHITFYTNSAWTLTDNATFNLNGDFVGDNAGNADAIHLFSDGTQLIEEGRSIN
jgi:hypothetical protein